MPPLPGLRRYLYTLCIQAVCTSCAIVIQAEFLARLLTGSVWLVLPIAALVCRGMLVWAQERTSARFAADTKTFLRSRVLRSGSGERAVLVTRGIDAVGPCLTGYLPQLVASVVVPVAVLTCLFVADWTSALIIAGTLPLVPVFAILVGKHTVRRTERQWALLSRLGGHFLDVVRGLETLVLFKRAGFQAGIVRSIAHEHASATMRTLRIAFLSSLVLELVATLSIALVAVPVGLRLLSGGIDLHVALLVLLLAPEAFLPLRAAGARFHAAAEGLTVLKDVLALPETRTATTTTARLPDLRTAKITFEDVTVHYPGRDEPALRGFWLTVAPGERIALVGPSGAGKSTVLSVVLGLAVPVSGRVLIGDTDLREIAPSEWHTSISWLPQNPWLLAAPVADNIRLTHPGATDDEVAEAARQAALTVPLTAQGRELSSGERQRVALARALVRPETSVALLDEPTARLDTATEKAVLTASRRILRGKTALVVAHRPAILPETDRVVRLE